MCCPLCQLSLDCITAWPFWGVSVSSLARFLNLAHLPAESRLEGWLSIPNRANIKRYGWRKQVCHNKKTPPLLHAGVPFPHAPLCPHQLLVSPRARDLIRVFSLVCGGEQQEDPVLQRRAGQRAVQPFHGPRHRVSAPPPSTPAAALADVSFAKSGLLY